jgi:hypothetical protein
MLLGLISDEAKFFPCLDIKDAFFYILLAPESQLIFAFQWEKSQDFFFFLGEKGQLMWTQLPLGFKNSPTIFGIDLPSDLKAFSADKHGCTFL